MVEVLVEPLGKCASLGIDRDAIVRIFDLVRCGLEIGDIGIVGQGDECESESGDRALDRVLRGLRSEAAPGNIAREERIGDPGRSSPSALLGFVDEDRTFPREGVDDEQTFGASLGIGGAGIEIAEVEHAFDAGFGDRLGEIAAGAGEHIEGFGRGGVDVVGLLIPLTTGPERLGRRDAGECAPGVLVVEGVHLVDVGGAIGRPEFLAALGFSPGSDQFGGKQVFVVGTTDAGLVGTGSDAIGPPVEPVAAECAEFVAPLIAEEGIETGGSGELDAGSAALGVPLLDEIGHAGIGRAVVDADGMRRLGIHEVVGVFGVGLETGDDGGKGVVDEAPVAEFGDRAAPEIVEAVPGEDFATSSDLPTRMRRASVSAGSHGAD